MNLRNFTLTVIAMAHFGSGNGLYAMDDTPTPISDLWEIILFRRGYDPLTEQDLEDAQQAINNGADIESKYASLTPIMHAVLSEQKPLVTMLIRAGANVNATSAPEALSPLMLANNIKEDNVIFRQLLEAGANTDHQNTHAGETVLHMIGIHSLSLQVDVERLCWLLHYGANTALRNHAGLTPLEQSSQPIQQLDLTINFMWLLPARNESLFLKRKILTEKTNHPAYKKFLHERVAEICEKHNAENVHAMIRDRAIYGRDARRYTHKLKKSLSQTDETYEPVKKKRKLIEKD